MQSNGSAPDSFLKGCSLIEQIRDKSENECIEIGSSILEGYQLLNEAYASGYQLASKKAIEYFVEGAFPVFDESCTLEILKILSEFGFDEALFLCGHYTEFGTDGNDPKDPDSSIWYYQRALEKDYEPAIVSLARRKTLGGDISGARELYSLAIEKDVRERREAVLSMGFIAFYGLGSGEKSLEEADREWIQMGETFHEIARDFCEEHPEPDLMGFLRQCKVNFEIGNI